MTCLDDDTAAAFALGRMTDPGPVAQHIERCAPCRVRVAVVASAVATHPAHTSDPTVELAEPATGRMRAPAIAPTPGTRLGRYVVLHPLGTGGMGVVVAAHDPELERSVAIKLVRADFWAEASAAARAQLHREARAMARLHHPNVVAVHDLGTEGDQLFVAMQRVPGIGLDAWLRRPRTWPEILAVCLGAGRGLAAAHHAGLVHRDVKPANILVDGEGVARIADFGLACLGRAPADTAGCGTPAYMAPEQHRGVAADARSDQFGFAATTFEALFGRRPFAGTTKAAVAEEIEAGRIVKVARRGVPRRVHAALCRALASDPQARFPSMDALLGVLATARSRPRWTSAAVGAAGIAVAIVTLGAGPRPAPRPAEPPIPAEMCRALLDAAATPPRLDLARAPAPVRTPDVPGAPAGAHPPAKR